MEDPGSNLISHSTFQINSLIGVSGCAYETRMHGSLCRHAARGGAPRPLSSPKAREKPWKSHPAAGPVHPALGASPGTHRRAELSRHLSGGHRRNSSQIWHGTIPRLLRRGAGEDVQQRCALPLDRTTGAGVLLQKKIAWHWGIAQGGCGKRVFS